MVEDLIVEENTVKGIILENGEKIGAHAHNKKSYKTYEWMQDK